MEKRRTDFLSFYETEDIDLDSCIRQSKVLPNALVSLRVLGIPMRLDFNVPMAYMAFSTNSLNRTTLLKKLSIAITCHFPSMFLDNSITTLCANFGSLLAIGSLLRLM